MYDNRKHTIPIVFSLVGLVFLVKLFFIQVRSDTYQAAAEKNIIHRVIETPYRGIIYDRNNEFLVYNAPIYDLMVIPKQVKKLDTLALCQDFNLSLQAFERAIKKAKAYSYVKPSLFIKNITQKEWAKLQDHLMDYAGFFITTRITRKYPHPILSNSLGYIGEIGPQQLASDTSRYYRQGDIIGISGLEKSYETVLRGQRGIRYTIRNARGIEQGSFKNRALDRFPTPGNNLTATIDATLQAYGEKLMQGKAGSIVMIAPKTGEILALVTSPTYDPNQLVGKYFSHNFSLLEKDTLCPLLNRPIMAEYPPGSIFKLVQTLIALQEKVISPRTTYPCDRRLVNCHAHPSPTKLYKAIQYSCNPYFLHVFRRIINQKVAKNNCEDTRLGFEKWYSYVQQFGLGKQLGIDIPNEKAGYIPDVQFYDKRYGQRQWKTSTIRSLDIGQGELLVTSLQVANLAAIIANRGYYYTPHVISKIGDQLVVPEKKHEVGIDPAHFEFIIPAMHDAVHAGPAWRAKITGIPVCGKTGTAENPHGEDHSVFMGFAPQAAPQVAIAVCVENAGWGSRAATAIAGLMIEKHLTGKISRPYLQDYVLKGNFSH